MFKLKKYLKPHIVAIILAILFLFGEAVCELVLPNLMSDIVNVGIQNTGVENASPEVISTDGMTLLKPFMSDNSKKLVEKSYKLVESGTDSAKDYENAYPILKENGKSVYVLTDYSDRSALDDAFGKADVALIAMMQDFAKQSGTSASSSEDMDISNVDITEMYKINPMLSMIPQSKFDEYIKDSDSTDNQVISTVGCAMTKLFYKEAGIDMGQYQFNYIAKIGVYMLLITLAGGIFAILVSLIASRVAAGVAKSLRRDLFEKVESFSNREFDNFSTASLITRTTNDITQIQMFVVMAIRLICFAPIMGIGGMIMALQQGVSLSWIILLAIVLLIIVMVVVCIVALPKFKSIQKMVDKLNLVTRESLTGMMVIRAFGTQKNEEERFDKANKDLTSVNLFVNRVMVILMPIIMLIMNGVTLLIVWVGAHQIEAAQIQIGDMMAFMQYGMIIIMAFLMIAVMFIMIPRASVSASRIAEVLESELSIKDSENPKSLGENPKGEISFNNVSFKYGNAEDNVIENISFTAKPGQTTAFIGSTGSGKSTLVNLIPRFYDVTDGSITFDGIDIRDITQHELRSKIGFVPQKGVLFSGDIASNLRYGKRDASDSEIAEAAKIAQAEDFINSKPEKYDSPIAQGGTNVSGGQKQRLCIARALAKKAPVYIFDDSFSALDFKTDAALRKALKKYTGDSTVLIVAQRISTIMDAEQIIVLDEGKMVGKGTHKELMQSCPTYREIASSQLSEEELK
ncbi:MAG: ABC transporter ATP-binding protein [Candidatus Pseudoruminococcus sp.]|uniref:ABC transporter ATP-binding protein n=1 Tax=Candidatus Pseudoruminococcus sp. TaxID=3101048 RepID=UPI002A7ADD2C|nr:ABC transporter ATP-binding protein/permease [Ruminococcus sp.]MDY2783693.1 ABC transporter ATP-binding protein [Candidatus Pseudoruminococcus sp.]